MSLQFGKCSHSQTKCRDRQGEKPSLSSFLPFTIFLYFSLFYFIVLDIECKTRISCHLRLCHSIWFRFSFKWKNFLCSWKSAQNSFISVKWNRIASQFFPYWAFQTKRKKKHKKSWLEYNQKCFVSFRFVPSKIFEHSFFWHENLFPCLWASIDPPYIRNIRWIGNSDVVEDEGKSKLFANRCWANKRSERRTIACFNRERREERERASLFEREKERKTFR